jgi:cyclase
MQQLTSNVRAETGVRGCNYGYVTTTDGIVMLDSPQLPSDAVKLQRELAGLNQPLRYIINTEPHGDHWTGNAFFDAPVVAHAGVRERILATDVDNMVRNQLGLGEDELRLMTDYHANAPVVTFETGMTLHVGNHTFEMIHMPGHTTSQAAILIKEEGVVWTSDNIFNGCQTFLQEADPDQWQISLAMLRDLDEEIFVPGHGEVCGKSVLTEQSAFIEEWFDYVSQAVNRGMEKDVAIKELTGMTDRYPMDIGIEHWAPRVMQMNVANLYDFVRGEGIHQRDQ